MGLDNRDELKVGRPVAPTGRKGGVPRLTRYGLTRADWDRIGEQQGWRCPGCDRPLAEVEKVCIDHAHIAGWDELPFEERGRWVRGLTCSFDNLTLKEGVDVARLLRLAEYLRGFEERRG